VSDNKDIQENKVLDKTYMNDEVVDDTLEMQFQYIKNIDILPMYSIHKPTIKLNKENNESIKYDIVTTVKNKFKINNERV